MYKCICMSVYVIEFEKNVPVSLDGTLVVAQLDWSKTRHVYICECMHMYMYESVCMYVIEFEKVVSVSLDGSPIKLSTLIKNCNTTIGAENGIDV